MIIRLIYDPKNTWECHRFDVDDFTLFGALSKIDAPKDLSDGDIVVSGNFSFYEHQDKQLKVIPNPIPTIQQNPHECNLCNLHKRVIRVGVPSEIHKKNPTILIVGMAPGREEDIENRPFVESAPAASIIREMVYEKLKLDRTEVAWTNIARCFPTDEQGNMRDPEMEEMLACSGKFLWNEIREIDPKVIVVVGNVAAGFLLNDPKLAITKVRGKIYKLKIGDKDYAVIPSIHPSAIARGQRQYYPMLLSDLVTAKSIGSTDVVMPRWTLVNDTKGVINVLKKIQVLYRAGLIDSVALDIESDQIHLEDNSKVIDKAIWQEEHSIVGTGLSWDENFGFFLAHYHPESKVDIEEVLPYYKEVLSEVPIRAQNAKYDQSWWLAKHGIDTILKHDTMLASFAYHGQSRSHGLKGLLASYFGWPPYDYDLGVMINLLPPDQRSFRNINLTKIAEYCCYDAIGTWKLSEHQIKYELFDKTKELFELLCRTSDTLRYAELYGAPIDLERLSRDEKRYEEENASDYENLVKVPIVQTYLDLKKKYTKDDKFSPASPNDLRSVIFGAYYCPDCQHYTYSRARGEKGRINPKTKSCLKCGSFNIERIIGLGIDPDEKQGYTDTGLPSTSQDNIDEIAKTYAHKHIASTESLIDGKFNCKLCKKLVEVDENFHVNPGFEDEVKVLQYINRIRKRNKLQGFFEGLHTFLKPVINESDQIGELIYNFSQIVVKTGRLQAFDYSIHTLPAHCLTKDTKISLLDGTEKSIEELLDKENFWVYSINEKHEIVPGLAHSVRKTGENQLIYKITLDNGESIRCTGNHPFLLRNGEYKRADQLLLNESLMPLYRKDDGYGYELVYNPNSKLFEYTHIKVCNNYFPNISFSGMVRHHKDFNKRNNEPINLQLMEYIAHRKLHNENASKTIHTPQAIRNSALARGKNPKVRALLLEYAKLSGKRTSQNHKLGRYDKALQNLHSLPKTECFIEAARNNITNYNKSENHSKRLSELNKERIKDKTHVCFKFPKSHFQRMSHSKNHSIKNFYDDQCEFCILEHSMNHKVVSIELDGYEDVYDLTVDKYHNFALSSGVFVHNSDVRRAVVSKDIRLGGLIVNADYAQIEPRILASVSGASNMIKIFESGIDIYLGSASEIFKVPLDKAKPFRPSTKVIYLGITYGKGASSVATDCNLTLNEAKSYIERMLREVNPEIGAWIDEQHRQAHETGVVTAINGRKYFFPNAHTLPQTEENMGLIANDERCAQNYPIQGPASDLTCEAATQIRKECQEQNLDMKVFALIHDQILNDCPPGMLIEALNIVKKAMIENTPKEFSWIKTPLDIEVEVGARWDGSVIATSWGDNWVKVKGPINFFNEFIEVAGIGYKSIKWEEINRKRINEKEDFIITDAYDGDKGGDYEIEAMVVLEK